MKIKYFEINNAFNIDKLISTKKGSFNYIVDPHMTTDILFLLRD